VRSHSAAIAADLRISSARTARSIWDVAQHDCQCPRLSARMIRRY
jgi:hypothetical protein